MLSPVSITNLRHPATLFSIGWAGVMLSMLVAIQPVWNTFIHSWRVELAASGFLAVLLAFAIYNSRTIVSRLSISGSEFRLIVLPILAFILWSALSIAWAQSWRSAVHHTLVWSQYLIFYLAVRQLLEKGRSYRKLVMAPALILAFYAVLAVAAYCTHLVFGTGTSLGMVYSKYGEQINTIFPLVLVGVLRQSGRRFIAGVALLSVLWLLIFCSLGRVNLFLFGAGCVAIAFAVIIFPRLRRYRTKLALIAIALVIAPLPLHLFSLFSETAEVPMLRRLDNTAAISNSNDFRRLMVSLGLEMFHSAPLTGIGGDNFGFEANNFRLLHSAARPDDPLLAQAESEIPERAHNEYLQVLAELGIVGAAIFAWFLFGIGAMAVGAARRGKKVSMHHIAAIAGLMLFLASSLVSSYSFRLLQNGFVFFFVLAVAARFHYRRAHTRELGSRAGVTPAQFTAACIVGMVVCFAMASYTTIRVASAAYTAEANHTVQLEQAIPLYRSAMRLDPENPEARYYLGIRLIENRRYADAVPLLRDSLSVGRAPSADFSYLATAQSLGGDHAGAERTMAEAMQLYPRSPFVLVRYAALLAENGKTKESSEQLERARGIDIRQANTWWAYLTEGALAASRRAFLEPDDFVQILDLQPGMAFDAVKFERRITFPDEGFNFDRMR